MLFLTVNKKKKYGGVKWSKYIIYGDIDIHEDIDQHVTDIDLHVT